MGDSLGPSTARTRWWEVTLGTVVSNSRPGIGVRPRTPGHHSPAGSGRVAVRRAAWRGRSAVDQPSRGCEAVPVAGLTEGSGGAEEPGVIGADRSASSSPGPVGGPDRDVPSPSVPQGGDDGSTGDPPGAPIAGPAGAAAGRAGGFEPTGSAGPVGSDGVAVDDGLAVAGARARGGGPNVVGGAGATRAPADSRRLVSAARRPNSIGRTTSGAPRATRTGGRGGTDRETALVDQALACGPRSDAALEIARSTDGGGVGVTKGAWSLGSDVGFTGGDQSQGPWVRRSKVEAATLCPFDDPGAEFLPGEPPPCHRRLG